MSRNASDYETIAPNNLHGNANDLSGRTFGRLTAVAPLRDRDGSFLVWLCRCTCGELTEVRGSHLTLGNTRSCGCSKRPDLRGERFGRLMAVAPTSERSSSSVVWTCRCDCGAAVDVRATSLRSGNTTSCKSGGPCSPNWQGGKTRESRLARKSPEFARVRDEVFERDDYTCRNCGSGGDLHPHHVLNFSQHPAYRYDPTNVVTLCASCHRQFHRVFGQTHNDRVEILQFMDGRDAA